ncbi:Limonene 1,2-monooxygenase [Zhongshania aliphaticivorans]|uniref:Luciferase-like monooxygenase n=1 Tax=Zhongshania aliphaticivorans TaxID=1470434 RepID=A0A5S9N9L9_9GAMM|nr:LLM class flavin-dependent oxidoreductase [Zhongshania aliphaticivorans]CAA0080356.1 Limonene 1,2-monooxygenase [Zhongshania aliphaticivorans]CAA0085717.1 Limonene 1,2-monooxygenase [Zhongshania aliphaticivorans]
MVKLSVLDLSPITEDGNASTSLQNSLSLAQHAEQLGFNRYWLAEHHNMKSIASAATAVVIGHIAAGTKTIRVGAGGIMLPNHAPLIIAEQFGTLEALFPQRIDLGLGRAPGTDQITAHAMRRNLDADVDQFPQDVVELMNYFGKPQSGQKIIAVPGAGLNIPVWILGSSLFGAQLAASLGLPYAFASHFAPDQMLNAIKLYRDRFRPSEQLSKPYVMLGYNVFAADSDAQAQYIASSMQRAFVNLRRGQPGKLQAPTDNYLEQLSSGEQMLLSQIMSCSAIGNKEKVHQDMQAFIDKTQADELMITSQIYSHEARLKSYQLVSEFQNSAHSN